MSPKHGFVGAIMKCNGNEITYFRTNFLDFERVAWYFAEKFSDNDYHEEVQKEVLESIKENGGFFLSKHFLKTDHDGNVMSCDGETIRNVNFFEAKTLAECLNVPELKSALVYGVIYDVLGKWLIETGALTEEEWVNSPKTESEQQELLTRDCGGWSVKEILSNIFEKEWTQEKYSDKYVVTREGVPFTDGEGNYPSRMRITGSPECRSSKSVIRAFLYFN